MERKEFTRVYDRVLYFYDIHKNSHHTKISNLAYEEYIGLLLEIINKKGWDLLKIEIENTLDRKMQQRFITLLTPVYYDFCKDLYRKYLKDRIPEYLESEPYGWRNFTDEQYIIGARELLNKIAKKRKISAMIFQ